MKIAKNIHLENSGKYFKVVEKQEAVNKKDGTKSIVDKNTREFGTVYQALCHIIESHYDVEKDLLEQFTFLVKAIEMQKDKIKDNFCTKVRSC